MRILTVANHMTMPEELKKQFFPGRKSLRKPMLLWQGNMLFICRRENLSYDAGKDEYRFFRISEKRSAASCDFCKSF